MNTASRESSNSADFVLLDGVSKNFGASAVLRDIRLAIRRNEFLTLLGPSGSGKTTCLLCLAGFLTPDAGRILVQDRDITHVAPERRNFGVVFQGYALFPHMTVAENVAYPLLVRKVARGERETRTKAALARVGLTGLEERRIGALSGGQQQRVALARALIFAPELLLLDEPLSALDRRLRLELQSELARIHRETGSTFLLVTHDQHEALSISDRVAVFNAGRIEQVAPPRDLYEKPATRFIAEFVGETNFFAVQVLGRIERDRFRVRMGEWDIVCGGRDDQPDSGPAVLCLRPEAAELADRQPEPGSNAVPVRVGDVVYFGSHVEVTVRGMDGQALKVQLPKSHPLASGVSAERNYWLVWPAGAGFLVATS